MLRHVCPDVIGRCYFSTGSLSCVYFYLRFYNDICRMVKEHKEGLDFQTELEETEAVEVSILPSLGKGKINMWFLFLDKTKVELASVAQLDAPSDWRPGGHGFNPCRGQQHSFVEIDHEIFSTVILSLPLIQEGQLSVSGERMCTILVNCLED